MYIILFYSFLSFRFPVSARRFIPDKSNYSLEHMLPYSWCRHHHPPPPLQIHLFFFLVDVDDAIASKFNPIQTHCILKILNPSLGKKICSFMYVNVECIDSSFRILNAIVCEHKTLFYVVSFISNSIVLHIVHNLINKEKKSIFIFS